MAGSERMILQCEQFEMAFPEEGNRVPGRPRVLPRNGRDTHKYAGLCSNCEKREACTYVKPEGGVWRCDEYV
jgi:hypothetical protein